MIEEQKKQLRKSILKNLIKLCEVHPVMLKNKEVKAAYDDMKKKVKEMEKK